ncbi:hypothetical protein Hypma_001669 [Hypsizygus marmoreus]|uniref:Uncharacterized protein n=1 Tax=Hypsizygus marmoreus TaxID=39966 RepID=A0A369J5I0_HYPMA|nr:hypothetical protein Hypma_001669 [Hypsizygus marmoreus]
MHSILKVLDYAEHLPKHDLSHAVVEEVDKPRSDSGMLQSIHDFSDVLRPVMQVTGAAIFLASPR